MPRSEKLYHELDAAAFKQFWAIKWQDAVSMVIKESKDEAETRKLEAKAVKKARLRRQQCCSDSLSNTIVKLQRYRETKC